MNAAPFAVGDRVIPATVGEDSNRRPIPWAEIIGHGTVEAVYRDSEWVVDVRWDRPGVARFHRFGWTHLPAYLLRKMPAGRL